MIDQKNQENYKEQEICVSCGFCCDGTLFGRATLGASEKEGLPELMSRSYSKYGDVESFKLPCGYFEEKCTIYDKKKAAVCSSYRCRLLKDFSAGRLSFLGAIKVIENAQKMRFEIMANYSEVFGFSNKVYFKEILRNIGKGSRPEIVSGQDIEYELFVAQCNIFETLLIRHFREPDEFDFMLV